MAKHEFKVGDRVRNKDGSAFSNGDHIVTVTNNKGYGGVWFKETGTYTSASLIELANPAPPTIRTITRREVVPGQYGIVEVGVGATVGVTFDPHTANDLREAAHLFLQIAEVLDEQAAPAAAEAPANDNDGWIEWRKGMIQPMGLVETRLRNGDVDTSDSWDWSIDGSDYDIVAYRPVKDAA